MSEIRWRPSLCRFWAMRLPRSIRYNSVSYCPSPHSPPPHPPYSSKDKYIYTSRNLQNGHSDVGSECWLIKPTHFFSFSSPKGNHTGYGQFKGTKASAQDIQDIYDGLKQSYLTDFDVLLSGYAPSAEAVQAIGAIARDLKLDAAKKPGSFFWGESVRESKAAKIDWRFHMLR